MGRCARGLVVAAALGLLVSCDDDGPDLPEADPAARSTTVSDGADSDRAEDVAASIAEAAVAAGSPDAAVAVVVGTSPAVVATAGESDLPDDAVFRIGSVTKAFTVTRLLQLADEGRLSLDDPIDQYVPDTQNGTATLRQLADMTSGIFNYTEDADIVVPLIEDLTQEWPPEKLIAATDRHDAYFAPGEGWHYSNTNTVLLGLVIEQVTGGSIAEEIERNVVAPLELAGTSYPTTPAVPDPHAAGYGDLGDGLFEMTESHPTSSAASGAMLSTAPDLVVFGRALARGDLVSAESQAERLRAVAADCDECPEYDSYGAGIGSLGGWWGHTGDYLGYQALVMHDAERDITVSILVNLKDLTNPAHLPTELFLDSLTALESLGDA